MSSRPWRRNTAIWLAPDVDLFVGQEGRHYRLHSRFNRKLQAEGYPWLADDVARLQRDSTGSRPRGAQRSFWPTPRARNVRAARRHPFVEGAEDLFAEGDEATACLWLWHFAEEYEHRTVCNDLFKELYGSYPMRLYGLLYLHLHLLRWVLRMARRLIRQDRRDGRIPDGWRSRLRFSRVVGRLVVQVLPRVLLKAARPSYDPADLPPPRGAMAMLQAAFARYGVAAPRD